MIFKQVQQVLDGTKVQTRRPVKEGERCYDDQTVATAWIREESGPVTQHCRWIPYGIKWQVGHTYAVQPGRGKKAVGRIRITKIRRERLQDISDEDCKAEGVPASVGYALDYIPGWQSLGDGRHFSDERRLSGRRGAFASMWDSMYPKEGNWLDNPECWVLDFERSEG